MHRARRNAVRLERKRQADAKLFAEHTEPTGLGATPQFIAGLGAMFEVTVELVALCDLSLRRHRSSRSMATW